jgi:hypothetical protein
LKKSHRHTDTPNKRERRGEGGKEEKVGRRRRRRIIVELSTSGFTYNLWEDEIGRITVRDHLRQTVHKTPISEITRVKWTGSVLNR